MSLANAVPIVKPSRAPVRLTAQLRAAGYRPGAPSPAIALADVAAYCRHACPECGSLRPEVLPFIRPGSYKVVLRCGNILCQHETEV